MIKYLTVSFMTLVLCFDAVAQAPCLLEDGKSGVEVTQTSDQLHFTLMQLKGQKWKATKLCSSYFFEPDCDFSLCGFMEYRNPYLVFDHIRRDSLCTAYSVSAVDMQTGNVSEINFCGKNLRDDSLYPGDYLIEGLSSEFLSEGEREPIYQYLDSLLGLNTRLIELSESDYKTDKSIQWWLANNSPQAAAVNIAKLDPDCSLVSAYRNSKHQSSDRYSVAVVHVRGYSEVIAYKEGVYSLVWVDPLPSDMKSDAFVKSYYMVDSNNLALIYYKGKTMFKRRINLANHSHSVK